MARGGERILQADLGLVAAAHDRALADLVLHAGHVAGRALDDQARVELGLGTWPCLLAGVDARGVGGRRPRGAYPGAAVVTDVRLRSFSALRETHSRKR